MTVGPTLGGLIGAIFLIVLGLLFLAHNLGWGIPDFRWGIWWPLLVIFGGFMALLRRR